MCNYDVVEWCVTLAKARETDLDHHGLVYGTGDRGFADKSDR